MDRRDKLILWSGGWDSTLLLTELAEEFSTKKYPIIAYSFVTEFLDGIKRIAEKRARKKYLRWARKSGYHIEHRVINITYFSNPPHQGNPQALFWFSNIVPFIPSNCDVYFGYICGDHTASDIPHFYTAYDSLKYIGGKINTELHYPYSYKRKWEIIGGIQNYKVPEDCIWTCEEPNRIRNKIVPCGKCGPCKSLQTGKFRLKLEKKGM